MRIELPEKKSVTKELLPQIIERIFYICRTDENFALKDKIGDIDNDVNNVKNKIIKQEKLLGKSEELRNDILNRISKLKQSNESMKYSLIESLGVTNEDLRNKYS